MQLRAEYGLDRPTFAHMLGVPETTLTRWEQGKRKADPSSLAKIKTIKGLLRGLAQVMRKGFISTRLTSPNDACSEAGARTPVDLLEGGNYAALEQMIYFFEAGEPF